jgi:hypothetical protein
LPRKRQARGRYRPSIEGDLVPRFSPRRHGATQILVTAALAGQLAGCGTALYGLSALGRRGGGGDDEGVPKDRRGVPARDMHKVEPRAGVAVVKPMKPTWCDVLAPDAELGKEGRHAGTAVRELAEKGNWFHGRLAAAFLCNFPDEPTIQEQAGYYVQYWVNASGGSVADVTAFLRYFANEERYGAATKAACQKLTVDPEASRYEKGVVAARRTVLGCDGFPGWFAGGPDGLLGLVDQSATAPSESVRALAMIQCAGMMRRDPLERPDHTFAYAACRLDRTPPDARKIDRELASYGEFAQIAGRLLVSSAKIDMARGEALAVQAGKDEPAWQRLIFQTAPGAWKIWQEQYRANQKLFDDASAFMAKVDGPSRDAIKGCFNEAWQNLATYAATRKPRSRLDVLRLVTDPVGGRALAHARACASVTAPRDFAAVVDSLQKSGTEPVGPRAAVDAALRRALVEIQADRSKFLAGSSLVPDRGNEVSKEPHEGDDDFGDVVKSVKKEGDQLVIEFAQRRWKEPVESCRYGSKPIGWYPDGTLRYESFCKVVGHETRTSQSTPVTIPSAYGAGLKPGVYVIKSTGSIPLQVYTSKNKKKLVAYYGIAL